MNALTKLSCMRLNDAVTLAISSLPFTGGKEMQKRGQMLAEISTVLLLTHCGGAVIPFLTSSKTTRQIDDDSPWIW